MEAITKKIISVILAVIISSFFISNCTSQDFTFNEKALVKKLKIKSKSMYYDLYGDNNNFIVFHHPDIDGYSVFDTAGNKTEDYSPDFNGPYRKNNYYYDTKGNCIQTIRKTMYGDTIIYTREYEFDSLNNLICERFIKPNDTSNYKTTYEYNEQNKLAVRTAYGSSIYKQVYEYDILGNLINTTDDNVYTRPYNFIKKYKYDFAGRIIESDYITIGGKEWSVKSNRYDEQGRLLQSDLTNYDGRFETSDTYEYDKNGRKTKETNVRKYDRTEKRSYIYSYFDDGKLGQLIKYESDEMLSCMDFDYYENGLIKSNYDYDKNNKLHMVHGYVYEYY